MWAGKKESAREGGKERREHTRDRRAGKRACARPTMLARVASTLARAHRFRPALVPAPPLLLCSPSTVCSRAAVAPAHRWEKEAQALARRQEEKKHASACFAPRSWACSSSPLFFRCLSQVQLFRCACSLVLCSSVVAVA
jgi:hypothetical protein